MSRPRLWTPAKGRGVEAVAFPVAAAERDPAAPPRDNSPLGCVRRDAKSLSAVMRGTVVEMQRLAADIDPTGDPARIAHALQQVMIAAANALALAGQARGITETAAHFEEDV